MSQEQVIFNSSGVVAYVTPVEIIIYEPGHQYTSCRSSRDC
jgi:hypothetical protein